MPEEEITVQLDHHNGENNLKIACCQFRFDFEYTCASREEYVDFLKLPPGDLSYYIHKQKLLCNDFEPKHPVRDGKVYAEYINNKLEFNIKRDYVKKKIRKEDDRYGIYDYDCVLNSRMEEEYRSTKVDIPDRYLNNRSEVIFGAYLLEDNNTGEIFNNLTSHWGILDDIGYFEKFNSRDPGGKIHDYDKVGIRFFSYILERKIDNSGLNPREAIFVYCSSKIQLLKDPEDLENKCLNLDKGKIVKSLRVSFNKGILAYNPLYLADDAIVKTIIKGRKWGIINYKYSGFIILLDHDKFTLLDKAKFELKTYQDPWRPRWTNREMWRRIIAKTFSLCHYELSPYFREPEKDSNEWEIFTHDTPMNDPEFHVIHGDEIDIYMTNYIKVYIKNPDDVLAMIKKHLLKAFNERVNILCLPELSLFLPHEKLQEMLKSVLQECINKNKENKCFLFSDILIFSTTYLKMAPNTARHVNLGIGVNIQFNDNGITIGKIKLVPFQKHFYAPVEYSKNNIAPGDYQGMKDSIDFLKWMNIHYWDVNIKDFPPAKTAIITQMKVLTGSFRDIMIYPFICSDFIANSDMLYSNKAILNAIKEIPEKNDRKNIIVVLSYSGLTASFYDNIKKIMSNAIMIVFANNAKNLDNQKYFGHSFIYHRGMILCKEDEAQNEKIDLLHFDSCSDLGLSALLHHNGTDFISCRQVGSGLNMIVAAIEGDSCAIKEVQNT